MSEEDKSEDVETVNDELFENHRIIVDPGQAPMRIDKFLMGRLENITRNRLQNAAKAGAVLVDGKAVKSNYKIKPSQTITILLDKPKPEYYQNQERHADSYRICAPLSRRYLYSLMMPTTRPVC